MKSKAAPGVEVCIRVDESALQEFEDEADSRTDPFRMVKYLEATSGAKFEVHVRTQKDQLTCAPKDSMWLRILFDGNVVERTMLDINDRPLYTIGIGTARGFKDGRTYKQDFKFSDLHTSKF